MLSKIIRKSNLILGGILLLGFLLRVWGISFGLPHLYHADEPMVVNHALAYGAGDLNPHFFKIPPLVSYSLFFCYGLFYIVGKLSGWFSSVSDFEAFFLSDPTPFYLIARLMFGVFLGTLSVYGLHRLVLQHFSRERALASALILAVCFLHVRDSHYVYADIPLILVMIASFFVFLEIPESEVRLRLHLQAGAWIGLAAAVKYNGAALFIPYVIVSLYTSEKKNGILYAIAACFTAFIIFLLLNPYALLDAPHFMQEILKQSKSQSGMPWLHHLTYSLLGGIGLPAVLLALLGMGRSLVSRDPKRLAFASFVIVYYGILCKAGQPYDRYVLPLLPFLAFFAADTICSLSIQWKRPSLAFLLFLSAFLPNLLKSILFDKIMMADDTRTQAKAWVETHLPAGSDVALGWDFYGPRLSFSRDQIEEKKMALGKDAPFSNAQRRRLDFLLKKTAPTAYNLLFLREKPDHADHFLFARPAMAYDFLALRNRGIDYVIVPKLCDGLHSDFYRSLEEEAELVMQFNPYRDKNILCPLDQRPLTGGPFLFKDLFFRERNGQILQVHKLKGT